MLSPGDLKRGVIIDIGGAPCVVEKVTMQTPSSRGASTIWRVRARNLRTKQKVDASFRSGDTIVVPDFEKRDVQFLYRDNAGFHFMDLGDYDQFTLAAEELEEEAGYLVDNMEGIRALLHDGEVIGIDLPLTVEVRITECDPAVKGNSATARTKNATLETGLVIQIPEHLSSGELVRVETATGNFVARVSR